MTALAIAWPSPWLPTLRPPTGLHAIAQWHGAAVSTSDDLERAILAAVPEHHNPERYVEGIGAPASEHRATPERRARRRAVRAARRRNWS